MPAGSGAHRAHAALSEGQAALSPLLSGNDSPETTTLNGHLLPQSDGFNTRNHADEGREVIWAFNTLIFNQQVKFKIWVMVTLSQEEEKNQGSLNGQRGTEFFTKPAHGFQKSHSVVWNYFTIPVTYHNAKEKKKEKKNG